MTEKKKDRQWDGRSRPSTDLYSKNFDSIFGKKQEDELKESYKQSLKNKKEREEDYFTSKSNKELLDEMDEEDAKYLKELKDKI